MSQDLLKELRIDRQQRDDDDAPKRWPWLIAALLVLVLVIVGGGYWLLRGKAVPVQVVSAITPSAGATRGAVLDATGYVTARREATVSAQIVGTLTEVLIEEGDHVKKGQVLARLENKSQQAYLNSAQANARAAQAQVVRLRAELAQAKRESTRQTNLAQRKLVPQQAAEQARTQVATMDAQLKAQQAQVVAAQAQVQVAQVNFDYTIVRAPFAGVITQKTAQVGEIIAPSAAGGGFTRTGVGTIVDMDSLEVDVDVNEAYIGRVKPNMPALAVLDAYPDWKIPAHVIAIVPTADRGKATIKVRVALDQKDDRVVPDMGVRVSFMEPNTQAPTQTLSGVLLPDSAIVKREGHAVVFLIDGDQVRQRRVNTTSSNAGMTLISAGLNSGDSVVKAPTDDLHDGARIAIAKSKDGE
ncbi:MAG: efflux RND transporter periplasmic adaptor subunit [Xanthomonadales bacterium]|nr:efflux RND transporter periplasmic adaptor subunit [Xanthomonadales bacterium]